MKTTTLDVSGHPVLRKIGIETNASCVTFAFDPASDAHKRQEFIAAMGRHGLYSSTNGSTDVSGVLCLRHERALEVELNDLLLTLRTANLISKETADALHAEAGFHTMRGPREFQLGSHLHNLRVDPTTRSIRFQSQPAPANVREGAREPSSIGKAHLDAIADHCEAAGFTYRGKDEDFTLVAKPDTDFTTALRDMLCDLKGRNLISTTERDGMLTYCGLPPVTALERTQRPLIGYDGETLPASGHAR